MYLSYFAGTSDEVMFVKVNDLMLYYYFKEESF